MQLTRHRRANLSVQALLLLLSENGIDASACLEGTGLSPSAILDAGTIISDEQEIEIVQRALHLLPPRAGYGIRSAGTFQATTYGIWGLAIISSPSVREALEIGTRYSGPFLLSKLRTRDRGDQFILEVDMHDLPTGIQPYIFERVYTTYMMFVRDMLPSQDPSIFEIHLPIQDPEYERQLEAITEKRVISGQDCYAVVTNSDWLDQPLPQADPIVHSHFTSQLQTLLKSQQNLPDHAQLIRDHMIDANRFSPRLEDVAAEAGLSSRSFRRRLQDEGTSFKEVVLATKMMIAKELLSTAGLSVSSTAHRLGYSETSSFSRAFSRWWGQNPGVIGRDVGVT